MYSLPAHDANDFHQLCLRRQNLTIANNTRGHETKIGHLTLQLRCTKQSVQLLLSNLLMKKTKTKNRKLCPIFRSSSCPPPKKRMHQNQQLMQHFATPFFTAIAYLHYANLTSNHTLHMGVSMYIRHSRRARLFVLQPHRPREARWLAQLDARGLRERLVDDGAVGRDHVLALPVLDHVQRLQGANDIFALDGRLRTHNADVQVSVVF